MKRERKKERKKESTKFKKCTSMASTNCYKFNIHSYRFCVSYIGVSVSRVGPTRTAYSIFYSVTSFPVESWASMPYEHREKPTKSYILYESTQDTMCHIGHTILG